MMDEGTYFTTPGGAMPEDIATQALDRVLAYLEERHHIQPLISLEVSNMVNGVELMMLRKKNDHAIGEFLDTEYDKIKSQIKSPPA